MERKLALETHAIRFDGSEAIRRVTNRQPLSILDRLSGPGPVAHLARGASAAFVAKAGGALAGFGAHLLLARWLGAGEYGIYSLALSWLLLLNVAARAGLPNSIVRFTSQYVASEQWDALRGLLQKTLRWILAASVGIALLGIAISYFGFWARGSEMGAAVCIALAALPVFALVGRAEGVLVGLRHPVLAIIPDAITRPVLTAMLAGLCWSRWRSAFGAELAMVCTGASAFLALVVAARLVSRSVPAAVWDARADAGERKAWFALGMSLLLMAVLNAVQRRADALLIGAFIGAEPVGYYAAAARYADLLSFGLQAVNALAAPMIAGLYAERRMRDLQRVVSVGAGAATGFALAGGIGLVVLAPTVLGWFGPEFRSGAWALRWLCAGQIVNAFTGSVAFLLTMTGRHDVALRAVAGGTVVNLILNCVLIPAYGISGAAVATGTSIALTNLLLFASVRRALGVNSTVFGLLRRTGS